MGNPRGVKRDFEALEKRRFKAAKLFDKNLNNSEIGRRLKVSNQTVSRWRKECQEGGNVALRRAGARACKRAPFVAEKFALEQRTRNRRAVEGDKQAPSCAGIFHGYS